MRIIKAYAKYNLGLNIYALQPNETKHKLKSLFIRINSLYDLIFIEKSETLKVEYFAHNKKIEIKNDIVIMVINFIKSKFHINPCFHIVIHKYIPVGSGLGGSSTDGAAILKFICDYYQLKLTKNDYKHIALNISSDLCFFLTDCNIALVREYGNKVKPIKATTLPSIKLIANNYSSNTKCVYQIFDELQNLNKQKNNFYKIIRNLNNLNNCIIINDLEKAAFYQNPALEQFKTKNRIMSGSGSYFIEWEEQNEN